MKLYLNLDEFGTPHWLGALGRIDRTFIREYYHTQWKEAHPRLYDAGFDPSQQRDKNGRWTREGQTNLGNKAHWIREKIDKIADDLGFPRDKVFMSDNVRKFTLNGVEYTSGGCAVYDENGFTDTDGIHYEQGDIVIYGRENTGFDFDMPVGGIVAHEIQHQRYREVMERAKKELNAATLKYNSSYPFDDANKHSARNLYPVAAAISDAGLYDFTGLSKLAQTDGVTEYSKAYWEAQAKGEVSQDLAINETLSEIANLEINGELRDPPVKIEFDDFETFVTNDLQQRYKERGDRMATPEEFKMIMEDPFAWAPDMVDRERFKKRFGVPFEELSWNARTRTVTIPDYNNETSKRVLAPEWRKLYDTINKHYKKLHSVKDAGFDPNQERDDHGRWAKVGSIGAAKKKTTKQLRNIIDMVADDLGYPSNRIFISDHEHVVTIDGQSYKSAAIAINEEEFVIGTTPYYRGDIVLFRDMVESNDDVEGVVAHEIEHMKFQPVLEKAKEEMKDLVAKYGEQIFAADGSIKPNYVAKLDVAKKLHKLGVYGHDADKLIDNDGVSEYSRLYWEVFEKNSSRDGFELAVHETLAEMSRLRYTGEADPSTTSDHWNDLFDMVDKEYPKLSKKSGKSGGNLSAVLKLGSKMRTVPTNRDGWPSTQATLDLYKTGYINPMNEAEVVWSEGDKIGMLEFGPAHDENTMYLKHIRTHPQRKGFGRVVMKELQDVASEKGLGIWLEVARNSDTPFKALKKFYTSLGFEPYNGSADEMIWRPKTKS